MQKHPITAFTYIPWIRWLERSELPFLVLGLAVCLVFLPFYDFDSMPPRMPMGAGGFPPAFAVCLMSLIYLARGASSDLGVLIRAQKIDPAFLTMLGPTRFVAHLELALGLLLGTERILAQIRFSYNDLQTFTASTDWLAIDFWIVALSILFYTVLQIHLLAYCIRQIRVFNKIAREFPVDLLSPELNNIMSNPLIRLILVAFLAASITLLLYEVVPYTSLQRRIIAAGYLGGVFWFAVVLLSIIPLFTLKSKIAAAKRAELDRVRRAIRGDTSGLKDSLIGEQLSQFNLPDLLFYEDRIKAVWDWPFEAQLRRLVIFGLIPPLTWVLAALVEVFFESVLFS